MKRKLFTLFILFVAVAALAQSGLMGGSDGIHQMNANTLGQWRFVVGTGGNVAVDPWALARGGVFYNDNHREKLKHLKLSATGNFFLGIGVRENVDIGVGIPINYDKSYAHGYLDATSNIRQGDLDLWMKVKAPFISDSSVVGLAAQFDLFMPTGKKHLGIRPRHAWFIRGDGYTEPYTANEVVVGATAVMTVDLNKVNVPLRWNTNVGFMYANEGANTLVYGTGLDLDMAEWITAFVELSGEFRVENNGMPLDFFEDPMLLTPGLRIHTPWGVDVAGGLDLSTRMMRVGYNLGKENEDLEKYTIGYVDEKGFSKTYGYTPTVTYAFTGLLTWTFGGAEKAPEPVCPQGLPPAPDTVKSVWTDTIVSRDTVVTYDTLVKVDTIIKTESYVMVDSVPDGDGDGVSDDLDRCPDSPKGITVSRDGCPRDFDEDGVPDYMDMCPNTAPGIGVDSTGCAKDEDRDGVADDNDQCPATPKGATVDTTGCPLDTDKDGVPDYLDKCPNNLHGVKVDKKGCPVNKKEDLESLKKGINFKSGSTILTKPSYKTLDDIVALLTKFADVSLEIQGHTDNVGDEEMNKNLSQGRAQSAVDYLIRKGISVSRLRAVGFGSEKPIADNKTKKGKAKNRRVELVPFYPDEQ